MKGLNDWSDRSRRFEERAGVEELMESEVKRKRESLMDADRLKAWCEVAHEKRLN